MNRIEINETIKTIKRDCKNLNDTLDLLSHTDPSESPESYEELVIRNYYLMETMSLKMRKLIFSNSQLNKELIMKNISEVQNVTVSIDDNNEIVTITLPALLPKKRKNSSNIFEPLYEYLNQYFSKHDFKKLTDSVVCFYYFYNENTSSRTLKDYDNYEQKKILDILSTFILEDDCSKNMDLFQSTIPSNKNYTKIIIFKKERFFTFIKDQNFQKNLK